ncbi:hypothetical protein BASA60_007571 [Batrachochytrium salamandrivorans]|nr:hypothetical protein BASA60_007571 [Batrachochytrium salamandrivorans]
MWVAEKQINGQVQDASLHASASLLALTLCDGQVQIYDDEGIRFEELSLKKDTAPTKIVWHPTKKYLAIAWNGGTVGLWCLDAESALREGKVHQCRIICLEWNPPGNRIISGDEDGGIVVWKVDARGRLSTMSQYRLKGQITCCVFRLSSADSHDPRHLEKESPPFFLASNSGSIYYADDIGRCTEVTKTGTNIVSLFLSEVSDSLTVLSDDLTLVRFSLSSEGKMTQESLVKLSGGLNSTRIDLISAWIEPDVLAMSIGGGPVRIWNASNEETYTLDRPEFGTPVYSSFKFNSHLKIMAVGSENGVVILWQSTPSNKVTENSQLWEPLYTFDLGGGGIMSFSWGIHDRTLAVKKASGVQIILQKNLCHSTAGFKLTAVQLGSDTIMIDRHTDTPLRITTEERIKDIRISKELLAIFTGKGIELHKLDNISTTTQKMHSLPQFVASKSGIFSINSKSLFVAENSRIDMFTHQGLLKNTLLTFLEDGDIMHMVATDQAIVLITRNHSLIFFDVGGREPCLISSKSLLSVLKNDVITSFSANCTLSMIAITVRSAPSVLKIYGKDSGNFMEYSFPEAQISRVLWDTNEKRSIVCELNSDLIQKRQVASLFATVETGIILKDIEPIPENCEKIIGASIPYFIYMLKSGLQVTHKSNLLLIPACEYLGVENETATTIKAITDFCFHLSSGNIDEAVKFIKIIKNQSIWENMAKICFKLGRISLAKLCLGKLKNAKALRTMSFRGPNDRNDTTEQAYLTSAHLGLYDEASEICSKMSRFDLQSELYQCIGQWEKAIEITSSKDRSSLPAVFHNLGNYLQEIGDQSGAIAAYEKSNTAKTHIPRMLLDKPTDLLSYIDYSSDMPLKVWWAQNAESHGDFETASRYYSEANDFLSIARVSCLSGNTDKAIKLADDHPDCAAVAYYLGRHFEGEGKISSAITYYSRAGSFSSAIRLAKENKIEKDLMHLALQSTPKVMNEVARYFESNGQPQKAIPLYNKTGNISRALDICYSTKDMEMLFTIVPLLDPNQDMNELRKAADFMIESGDTEKAIQLFLLIHNYDEILSICQSRQVALTEEIIDKIHLDGTFSASQAKSLHLRMAEICFAQGSHQLACKQYTLAGDRLRAMGSLLKSGDKEKDHIFCQCFRTKTTRYLSIIQFYTKAKAHIALATFYHSCALIEIDEFQNYEKAIGALKEAEKCHSRVDQPSVSDKDAHENIQRQIHYIQIFLEAQQCAKNQDLSDFEHICTSMLNEPDIDSSVRCGDIYGLLIETLYTHGSFDQARKYLGELITQHPDVVVDSYVDRVIVHTLGGVSNENPQNSNDDSVEEDF